MISLFGLENMWAMGNRITFARTDQAFLQDLNSKVDAYFKSEGLSKYGNSGLYLKVSALISLYVFCYASVFFVDSVCGLFLCYACMGPLTVFLALNIGHEAAHHIFCKNKKLNNILVHVFDFLGASSQIWKYKHVHSHHQHTNIHKVDLELEQPNIVRIFPQSAYRFFHRYQQFYMPFLYSIYTMIWFCSRDYKDFFALRKAMTKGKPHKEAVIFFIGKLFFLSRMIFIPAIVLPFSVWQVLGAFLICNVVASITVTFALISTHVGEHSHFPELNADGNLDHSWVRHQFMTTSDFSTDSKVVTALYGGFNHHLTHHLFPYISHVHYGKVTKIIREVSKDYNFVLHPQPTILAAMASHFRLLKRRAMEGKGQLEWMEM